MDRKELNEYMRRRGVGDHSHERLAPHEIDDCVVVLKRLQAQETAKALMRSVGVEPR